MTALIAAVLSRTCTHGFNLAILTRDADLSPSSDGVPPHPRRRNHILRQGIPPSPEFNPTEIIRGLG